jgi:GDP-L-fucose synthase
MNLREEKIWIAGHTGMVGSAISRKLQNLDLLTPCRRELDLTDYRALDIWFKQNRPSIIFNAAAKVGGIMANSAEPVTFLLENLKIQNNIFEIAHNYNVKKMIFLGSACCYPGNAAQPISEDSLLQGPPEITNIWYATAKIAGLQLARAYKQQYGNNFVCAMPTNAYGPNDNFTDNVNHVIPALLKRFHFAKMDNLDTVNIWGSGKPLREFLFVDDLADAIVFLMHNYDEPGIINIGSGEEISIYELAAAIASCVGYQGAIKLDISKPDGVQRKLLDSQKLLDMGWHPKTNLKEGLEKTYIWALKNQILHHRTAL